MGIFTKTPCGQEFFFDNGNYVFKNIHISVKSLGKTEKRTKEAKKKNQNSASLEV